MIFNIVQALKKGTNVKSISIPDEGEGKVALSLKVGDGAVSFLFNVSDIDVVEVYDPENLLEGGVYYLSLVDALKLILNT
jgi:hypothetical protein